LIVTEGPLFPDAAFPKIHFQEAMKINQIIDELGSLDNERNPRTSMIVDDDDVDDVQVVV